MLERRKQATLGRRRRPGKAPGVNFHHQLLRAGRSDSKSLDRQRVDHLVGNDGAGEFRLRRRGDPFDARAQVFGQIGQRLALNFAQRRAGLEQQVFRRLVFQLQQHVARQRSGTRPQLQHRPVGAQRLRRPVELTRNCQREQSPLFGRGDEVAGRAESVQAVDVIAQSRFVQRHCHESAERNGTFCFDRIDDPGAQLFAERGQLGRRVRQVAAKNCAKERTMTEHSKTRAAIVTGGARRIGAAIVKALHARGLNVLIHCRNSRAQADELAARLNDQRAESAAVIEAELSDDAAPAPSSMPRFRRSVGRRAGQQRIGFLPTPVADSTAGGRNPDWHALIDSNQRAPFWLSLEFARAAADAGGSIVNLVDIHGIVPLADHAIYSQAKAGLIMQTKALAKDLAPEIRVNGVAPGTILWPEGDAANSEEAMRDILERVPLRRQGRPEDIAGAVTFLALDAPYITGQILAVDGGRLLNM